MEESNLGWMNFNLSEYVDSAIIVSLKPSQTTKKLKLVDKNKPKFKNTLNYKY